MELFRYKAVITVAKNKKKEIVTQYANSFEEFRERILKEVAEEFGTVKEIEITEIWK